MTPSLGKGRRRALQRGAILVESLIVSTLLITSIIGGLFFHRVYAAKLRAIREARFLVWQAANSPGCGGANIDLQGILAEAVAGLGRPLGSPDEFAPPTVGAGVAGGGRAPSFFGAITRRSQASSSSATGNEALGAGTYSMRAVDTVACNETPASPRGDMLSIFGFAARNVLGGIWAGAR
jgi:hypothetical protein